MFPAASVSVSKNLVETNVITSDTKDILTFGEDEEAERLLRYCIPIRSETMLLKNST
jgi:hypothetical protein